jgi:hypothetical protein
VELLVFKVFKVDKVFKVGKEFKEQLVELLQELIHLSLVLQPPQLDLKDL